MQGHHMGREVGSGGRKADRCSRVLFLTFKFEMSYVDGDVEQAAG